MKKKKSKPPKIVASFYVLVNEKTGMIIGSKDLEKAPKKIQERFKDGEILPKENEPL